MAAKNQLPTTAPRASAAPPTKHPNGLWLDISPPLLPPHDGAALGPHGSQGLWMAPGQTQTLQAQGSRRYRLRLRAKQAPTEALTPAEQPLLVLRHGEDLWMSNAQAAGLVLNGFFATPDNQLDIELGEQAWRVDGLATGQPIAGSQAHLLYWHGQAAQWPDAFNVSTAEGGFELHKTQWQSPPAPAPAAEATASGASSSAATITSTEAASAANAASSAAALAPAEAASAASATTGQAAATAAASGAAAQTAAAAVGVGLSGSAAGAVALGVGAIAAATSGKKADTVAATTTTDTNTNTNTNNSTALADNAAAKASAEGAVAQAQVLQAGLVDNAQAALSRAQTALTNLPSTASTQARAQAEAAVALAQKDLSASQSDLAQAQALTADKAAADKAAADAWAQAQAQATKAQAALANAPAGSEQALAAQAALAQANKALAQSEATAAQKAAADKVYAQNMAEVVQAQASAQAALDNLSTSKHHDGQVHDASQYVFSQGQGQTDLQGLAAQFDTNHDGVFNAQDAKFTEFAVWQDRNQNGVSDAGEVRSLADVGLTALNLQSDGVARQSAPGVHEAGRSSATASDGSSVLLGDVGFAFTSLTSVAATSAKQGEVNLSSDTSANLLQLSLQDLLALPTETLFDASNTTLLSGAPLQPAQHQLMVTGDSNDVVKIDPTLLTDTHTVVSSNDHSYHVYTVDSAHTQLLIDHNIVNAGRVL